MGMTKKKQILFASPYTSWDLPSLWPPFKILKVMKAEDSKGQSEALGSSQIFQSENHFDLYLLIIILGKVNRRT